MSLQLRISLLSLTDSWHPFWQSKNAFKLNLRIQSTFVYLDIFDIFFVVQYERVQQRLCMDVLLCVHHVS